MEWYTYFIYGWFPIILTTWLGLLIIGAILTLIEIALGKK